MGFPKWEVGSSQAAFESELDDYADGEQVAQVVAAALETACANQSQDGEKLDMCSPSAPLIFYAKRRQAFSLSFFVRRLMQQTDCSNVAFTTALVYLDRLRALNPNLRVTALNVHRLYATALLLAIKYHEDEVYVNSFYADIFGMRGVHEINRLESAMLQLLQFRLYVHAEEHAMYRVQLFMQYSLSSPLRDSSEECIRPTNAGVYVTAA